jgi:uncharacterized ferritin-like protein (DUF455 family)
VGNGRKTRDDLLARLALVPRTLEARGLDVTPGVSAKLAQAGDKAGADILMIIYRDEIGHVAIGNAWYKRCVMSRAGCDCDLCAPGHNMQHRNYAALSIWKPDAAPVLMKMS